MANFTHEAMQARFHEISALIADIETKSAPLRLEHDRVSQTMENRCKQLAEQFKAIEKPLFDLKQERSLLVKALSGKTGKPV